jgi:hypothetical protein
MTFRDVQNKVRWVAFTSGALLVGTQWYKIQVYPKWNGAYPPPEVDLFVMGFNTSNVLVGLIFYPGLAIVVGSTEHRRGGFATTTFLLTNKT